MPAPQISFEFFPPRNLDAAFKLWEAAQALAPYEPAFVSVTYGAGGTTHEITHEAARVLQRHYNLNTAAHLTCVGASCDETLRAADAFLGQGIHEIVALRGDPPAGAGHFVPHPDGFVDSIALIEALAARGEFKIRVGAYPEPHPESSDSLADVRWLKRKFEAGAHSAITQFFFEAETFLRFRDLCVKEGITQKIIPGILPIHNWEGAKKFAGRCGAHVPARLDAAFTRAKNCDSERLYALAHCTQLCEKLVNEGVEDLHFYTLNRSDLTHDVLIALGAPHRSALQKVA